MKKIILLLLTLTLTACGRPGAVFIDPELEPYLASFPSDVGVSLPVLNVVKFGHLDSPVVGLTLTWSDHSPPDITIDPMFWKDASDNVRQQVIYHELGHAFGLGHNANTSPDTGCPISIMNPWEFGDLPCYFWIKPVYFSELHTELTSYKH